MKFILLQIIALLLFFQSCIVNSTITDVPLIKEKGQSECSIGISGPIPGAHISYAYGLSDKYYMQTVADVSLISAQIQQSFGMYKQLDEWRYREKSFGYLLGEGAIFTFGESSMYGTYNLWFTNFTLAKTSKKHPRIATGFCFKPGFLYLNYVLSHDVPDTSNHDYPFKRERLTNQKYFQIYYGQQFFAKADLLQMKLGFYAQIHGGWVFHDGNNGPHIWPATIGLSYQYKKADKKIVQENREKRESKYDYKQIVGISFSSLKQPYPNRYRSGILKQDSQLIYPRILLSYQFQLQYWLSMKALVGYYSYKGYYNYTDSWTNKSYHVNYKYVEPIFDLITHIHWVNSSKLEVHSGFRISTYERRVYQKSFSIDTPIPSEVIEETVGLYKKRFQILPIGMSYSLYKSFGIQADYFLNGEAQFQTQNFLLGINAKF